VYLTSFTARGIKCFENTTLNFPSSSNENYAGWNVILGANATGKTTLLQAMAATLVGTSSAMRLMSPAKWVRRGEKHGSFEVKFIQGERDIAEGAPRAKPYSASFAVTGTEPVVVDNEEYTAPQIVLLGKGQKEYRGLVKGPYAANKPGWLVCGYGAHRRLTGGAEDALTYEAGRVGRVASLFRESVALKRDLDWLPQLYAKSLDTHAPGAEEASKQYETVRKLLDQLLPAQVQIADVDTERVYFSAPGTSRVDLLELSDGYRSFLALVLDLLRQVADVFGSLPPLIKDEGASGLSVLADGVVLIDEVDLHLHPTWQRQLGPRLMQVFPRFQFIVTSHSPFIAQAATRDGLFVFWARSANAPVQMIQPAPQVSGWTAEQILLSPLFGLSDTRNPETERLLAEHALLRGKAKFDGLSPEDKRRLAIIERELAERLTAPGELQKEEVDDAVRLAAEKVRRLRSAETDTTPNG
jgi:energy-coupling factor transporter ATP-binding protein EcfA2